MKKTYLARGILVLSIAALQLAAPSIAEAYAGNCYAYASKGCVSNVSYWYDSCGAIQAVNQNCNNTGQTCSNGMCVGSNVGVNPNPTNYPVQTYIKNYRTACYNNNIFWYDSNSVVQGLSQSCSDTNSCTTDSCSSNKCSNVLKCDGSTCAVNSPDYINFCLNGGQNNNQNTGTNNQPTANQGGQVAGTQTSMAGLSVIMFASKQSTPTQWSKLLDAANGDSVNFIIIFKNTSGTVLNDVIVQSNLTNSISYTGNLKVDNSTIAGSIVSGIGVGILQPGAAKTISFTGTVQPQNVQTMQVTSTVSSGSMRDSDYLTINVPAGTLTTAAVSGSGFVNFVKKWYLWAIIILVLIILFFIIFRRLSTSA